MYLRHDLGPSTQPSRRLYDGIDHAKKAADGRTDTPIYRRVMLEPAEQRAAAVEQPARGLGCLPSGAHGRRLETPTPGAARSRPARPFAPPAPPGLLHLTQVEQNRHDGPLADLFLTGHFDGLRPNS